MPMALGRAAMAYAKQVPDRICGPAPLKEIVIDGTTYYTGFVRLVGPEKYFAILDPFIKIYDEQGNRFHLKGLVAHFFAIEAARRKEAIKVVCRKLHEGEYEVVRWY